VAIRSGALYLIDYDRGSRGWRTFALDRFRSKPASAGTFTATRIPPPEYASRDLIGFMKIFGKRIDVTVELSAIVALSATARIRQADQRTELLPDGRAQMTFSVADASEVVRCAPGCGADARIVASSGAVATGRDKSRTIADAYGGVALQPGHTADG